MKYEIFFKQQISKQDINFFHNEIKKLYNNPDFINKYYNRELIFTVGGDGTFLEAVSKYGIEPLYIPINEGTLGFYTSWTRDNLDEIVNDNQIINASLLKIKMNGQEYFSINETTIINPVNTQILNVYINNIEIENFRGTGLCISTPTGSTAYNKSLGGALIDYNKKLFQLVKIAPINNVKYRTLSNPFILTEHDILMLKGEEEQFKDSIITIDRKNYEVPNTNIEITLAKEKIQILSSNIDFWTKVKNKFIH